MRKLKKSLSPDRFQKKLLLLLFLIHINGCSTYIQWWDEEMFLYRPSVIESAAMRPAATEKKDRSITDK